MTVNFRRESSSRTHIIGGGVVYIPVCMSVYNSLAPRPTCTSHRHMNTMCTTHVQHMNTFYMSTAHASIQLETWVFGTFLRWNGRPDLQIQNTVLFLHFKVSKSLIWEIFYKITLFCCCFPKVEKLNNIFSNLFFLPIMILIFEFSS